MTLCRICKKELIGRPDKIFCSIQCKNFYHTNLRNATKGVTVVTDNILHRNRSILLELIGKNAAQKKINRIYLDKKKFNYHYCTGFYINSKGKMYHNVYDFAWMEFSDNEILIVRRNYAK